MTKKSLSKRVSTTVYLEPRQVEELQGLKERTGLSMAECIRRGIDAILEKNKGVIDGTEKPFEDLKGD
jgi:hypothetical protein